MLSFYTIGDGVEVRNSFILPGAEIRRHCTLHEVVLGAKVKIYEEVCLKRVQVGEGAGINAGTYIENAVVGAEALIGPNCSIVGVAHELTPYGAKRKDTFDLVTIGKGCWLGAGCNLGPGVEIGEGSVVGMGAVVVKNKNIPPFHIYVGVPPNQTIMSLEDWLGGK